MSWSLSEARALAIKASRGAGYPWGLAEEAGFALIWLGRHGLPGPAVLAGLLEGGCAGAAPCPRCPLARGAEMADLGEMPAAEVLVRYPLLLVPFAARLLRPLSVRWTGAHMTVAGAEVFIAADDEALLAAEGACSIVAGGEGGAGADHVSRIPSSAANAIDALTRLAARTYAPATEASRLAGAGAGTTDND